MKTLSESSSELRAYIAGLREEENRNKLIGLIVVGSVLIKKKNENDSFDDWDDEWDDDECCCDDDECCCTDSDVDKSVKVEPYEK